MRILHLSDVHIGVENYGRPATLDDISNLPDYFAPGIDREEYVGSSTRMIDFLCTLDAAVSYAINNRVDFVVFSGDAYKNRDPSQTHQREFARRINRVANANIPVFLTVGNHDLPHVSNRATALEIFPTLSVSNVFVGSTLKTHLIKTNAYFNYKNFVFVHQGFVWLASCDHKNDLHSTSLVINHTLYPCYRKL